MEFLIGCLMGIVFGVACAFGSIAEHGAHLHFVGKISCVEVVFSEGKTAVKCEYLDELNK